MHFLVDQDVYQMTIEFLRNEGHDVIPIKELGLEQAADLLLLQKAKELERIFVTRDRDFGALVFLEKETSNGVIFLRGKPAEIKSVHDELRVVLKNHTDEENRQKSNQFTTS